ncbi:Cytochrome P450, E-class, group I [Parasponia andersonii]|uniref:Cytochrome P450, E-class, group I n=1 Tax=Parasponia andersonii TaxID=3476 RepID=A0A2P5BUJ4_PARAD|nr:Cytochrome P450, E-class, group I [Parasponia andersonii]
MELDTYELLSYLLYIFLIIWISIQAFDLLFLASKRQQLLPPGPRPFPIIGNLLELGDKPHKSLAKLSHTHGPIMRLKLGQMTTVVVSSAAMAKVVLQTHDQLFSNRTIPDSIRACEHHEHGMPWIPASTGWRNLRKICNSHLFSAKALDTNQNLRHQKVQELLADVRRSAAAGVAVDISRAGFMTSLNLLSTTFFSVDWADPAADMAGELKEIVWDIMEAVAKPNLADYFPLLKKIDPQGIRRGMTSHFRKMMGLFDRIINQRLRLIREANSSSTSAGTTTVPVQENDTLDTLLSYITSEENRENQVLDKTTIEHLLLDLFAAGTDTTSSTLEWSMTELLRKPEILSKAQAELERVIGKGNQVKESDIAGLPYLQAIIKETFRLHPPAPLLLPRKAETDVEVCGYTVPKGAQVLVNVWAISRDPSIWDSPNEFIPERFLESNVDVKGRHFELLPFGGGRRICPGLPLATRMVHLMLGSLIHSFDWKLEGGVEPESMNMEDRFGITLQKAEPLRALAMPIT